MILDEICKFLGNRIACVKNHQNKENKRIWDLAGKNGIKWAGIIENRGFAVHCPFFYS